MAGECALPFSLHRMIFLAVDGSLPPGGILTAPIRYGRASGSVPRRGRRSCSQIVGCPLVCSGAGRSPRRRRLVVAFAGPSKVSPAEIAERELSRKAGENAVDHCETRVKEARGQEGSRVLWDRIPYRYKLVLTSSLAFAICNMDKVNLSVAIIPMSNEMGWNASTAGLVQSSFFWGYALSQLPGGWLAKKFTGKMVLEAGVLIWSMSTAMVPVASSFIPGLLFCRFLVGLGEGVSPAAATDLIARIVPATERSRAVAFVFSGLSLGSVVGLLLTPACIEAFGWKSVFYIFGILGVLWYVGFQFVANEVELDRTVMQREEYGQINLSMPTYKEMSEFANHDMDRGVAIPWEAFFRSSVVWSMVCVHFCGNWGYYNCLSWLPTYFSEELHLDLTNASLVSILPPLASILVSSIASSSADHLISKGVNTTFVRKICQTIAFVSPGTCMAICSFGTHLSPWVVVSVLTVGLALSSFSLAGLYCTHQDISPKYASILLGITNTAGAVPGIIGVYLTGYLLDQTHSWSLALFAPSIFFYITGTVIWNLFASCEPQLFDS